MRSNNLQLPCVQPPTSSFNLQLRHGRPGHGGHGDHGGHGGHGGCVGHGGCGGHGGHGIHCGHTHTHSEKFGPKSQCKFFHGGSVIKGHKVIEMTVTKRARNNTFHFT